MLVLLLGILMLPVCILLLLVSIPVLPVGIIMLCICVIMVRISGLTPGFGNVETRVRLSQQGHGRLLKRDSFYGTHFDHPAAASQRSPGAPRRFRRGRRYLAPISLPKCEGYCAQFNVCAQFRVLSRGLHRRRATDLAFNVQIVVQNDIQQRTVDLDVAVVIDQAEATKFIHEKVDA